MSNSAMLFAPLLEGLGPCHLASPDGDIIYTNRLLQELLALHEEPLPKSLPQNILQRSLRQADGVRANLILRRDRTERHFKLIHRRLGSDGGSIPDILTLYEETTKEANALTEIRRVNDRSDDITRVVSDWVWETDLDWKIVFLVTRDGTILGRPVETAIATSLFDLGRFIPNSDRPKARLPQPRQRAAFYNSLFRAQDARGVEQLFLISAVPIFDELKGDFVGFRGSAADVTDRLAAEADARVYRQLLESTLGELKIRNEELSAALDTATIASKAKTNFLGIMSHELRTPLNAVLGFSEVMQMEAFGPLGHANYKNYVSDILKSGRFLLAMINDILDLVKLEGGEMQSEALSVSEIVNSCCRLVGDMAGRKSITIKKDVARSLVVSADAKRFQQLVLNLVSNAVKFTPDGGEIEVSAEAETDSIVAIHCCDTGIGISAEMQDIIFEPFGQVDSTIARNQEGSGLGLPIARMIAKQHGGSLTVASAPGSGSTFTIRLPMPSLNSRS